MSDCYRTSSTPRASCAPRPRSPSPRSSRWRSASVPRRRFSPSSIACCSSRRRSRIRTTSSAFGSRNRVTGRRHADGHRRLSTQAKDTSASPPWRTTAKSPREGEAERTSGVRVGANWFIAPREAAVRPFLPRARTNSACRTSSSSANTLAPLFAAEQRRDRQDGAHQRVPSRSSASRQPGTLSGHGRLWAPKRSPLRN